MNIWLCLSPLKALHWLSIAQEDKDKFLDVTDETWHVLAPPSALASLPNGVPYSLRPNKLVFFYSFVFAKFSSATGTLHMLYFLSGTIFLFYLVNSYGSCVNDHLLKEYFSDVYNQIKSPHYRFSWNHEHLYLEIFAIVYLFVFFKIGVCLPSKVGSIMAEIILLLLITILPCMPFTQQIFTVHL